MRNFDASKHPRDTTRGTRTSGQFVVSSKAEPSVEISLDGDIAPQATRSLLSEYARRHPRPDVPYVDHGAENRAASGRPIDPETGQPVRALTHGGSDGWFKDRDEIGTPAGGRFTPGPRTEAERAMFDAQHSDTDTPAREDEAAAQRPRGILGRLRRR